MSLYVAKSECVCSLIHVLAYVRVAERSSVYIAFLLYLVQRLAHDALLYLPLCLLRQRSFCLFVKRIHSILSCGARLDSDSLP